MTDATARREMKAGDAAGFCGFCFVHGQPGDRLAHRPDCKLVREHGRRINILVAKAEPTALVVTISKHGGPVMQRALWRVSVADARKICTDPRTSLRNSALHYFLDTSLPEATRGEAWDFTADNGRWAPLLAELGVTVLESRAQPRRTGVAA